MSTPVRTTAIASVNDALQMDAMTGADWRALIAVTTCEREPYLRRSMPQLARATVEDPRLTVLVSHDGPGPDTQAFCERWRVPLIYSDNREGVGISKNRVLERFPDFDYYFFLEDDVEVVDRSVFAAHVGLAHALGIHHMSLTERRGVHNIISETSILDQRIIHALYGGAVFNFFSRYGLERVGGWHPAFARYRRWGHTEHSYRFLRTGLAPAPFNVAITLSSTCIWHIPPSVTHIQDVPLDEHQIAVPERELMDQQLTYVPVQTFSPYHFNGVVPQPLEKLAATLDGGERYPLLSPEERRRARSDARLWQFQSTPHSLHGAGALATAIALRPQNPAVRHEVKMLLSDARGRLRR